MRGIVCVLTSETIELVTLIFKMRRHVPQLQRGVRLLQGDLRDLPVAQTALPPFIHFLNLKTFIRLYLCPKGGPFIRSSIYFIPKPKIHFILHVVHIDQIIETFNITESVGVYYSYSDFVLISYSRRFSTFSDRSNRFSIL